MNSSMSTPPGAVVRLAAVGRLVPPVSHDINNPLAALLGRIQIHLSRGSAGVGRGTGGLDDMYEQALIISDKVQILGSLARQAVLEDPPVPSVLSDHVGEITQMLGRHIGRRCTGLCIDIPASLPPVLIRPVDLKLCIAELLLAICQASTNPAELRILAEARDDRVTLALVLEGVALSESMLPPEGLLLMEVAEAGGIRLEINGTFVLTMPKGTPTRPLVPQ